MSPAETRTLARLVGQRPEPITPVRDPLVLDYCTDQPFRRRIPTQLNPA
ncbi:MAG: hypothetical protein WKF96_11985 [Solirubrobacteraceae bacterium]